MTNGLLLSFLARLLSRGDRSSAVQIIFKGMKSWQSLISASVLCGWRHEEMLCLAASVGVEHADIHLFANWSSYNALEQLHNGNGTISTALNLDFSKHTLNHFLVSKHGHLNRIIGWWPNMPPYSWCFVATQMWVGRGASNSGRPHAKAFRPRPRLPQQSLRFHQRRKTRILRKRRNQSAWRL